MRRRFGPYIEQLVLLLKVKGLSGLPMLGSSGPVAVSSVGFPSSVIQPAAHTPLSSLTLLHCRQAPEITAELFVEVLGCLANLYLPEFDFFTLVCKHDLMHFLATYAQPGAGARMRGGPTSACTCCNSLTCACQLSATDAWGHLQPVLLAA